MADDISPVASDPADFRGLWRRLLLSIPGQPVDTLTRVDWLQGPGLYVDLRQPVAVAGAVRASCLAEVTAEDAALLTAQEGFAGRFTVLKTAAGLDAEWHRTIDFRPCPLGDRGRLESHGDLLIEHGLEADYIEHWQRTPDTPDAVSGAALLETEADGRTVILVRHGRHFGYARARAAAIPAGAALPDLVAAASAEQARALLDCEIALGTVTRAGWRIDRSSLPWREGAILLAPEAMLEGQRLTVTDMDPRGLPFARTLRLMRLNGSLTPDAEYHAPAPPPRQAMPASTGPFQSIPVVDIAGLDSDDAGARAAAVEGLARAAGEIGFLHITGHGIAPPVIDRLQRAARAFFDLPLETKLASHIGGSANHRGYVPEGEEQLGPPGTRPDRKEAFDLALDLAPHEYPAGHPMLGPNRWPAFPGFREDVMAYYAAAFAVGQRLLGGFAQALGQPADSFAHLVTRPPSQLRLIHYPHDAEALDAPGIGAHTDYECFTLLLATAPGLEVMNGAGEWIDAPPVPGALVVNIGDMLEYWSGGAFVATSHRVRKVAQERWSFPLFFALDYDTRLRPLGRPEADPIQTGEHLYAQTIQTFRYLKDRAAAGTIALPPASRPLATFGQHARQPAA